MINASLAFRFLATAVSSILTLCACGGGAPPGKRGANATEGALDIIAWPGYIERGESNKQYDWVSKFEQDTGCKVNVKIAGNSEELVSLMKQGGYDLVIASGDVTFGLVHTERCNRSISPV